MLQYLFWKWKVSDAIFYQTDPTFRMKIRRCKVAVEKWPVEKLQTQNFQMQNSHTRIVCTRDVSLQTRMSPVDENFRIHSRIFGVHRKELLQTRIAACRRELLYGEENCYMPTRMLSAGKNVADENCCLQVRIVAWRRELSAGKVVGENNCCMQTEIVVCGMPTRTVARRKELLQTRIVAWSRALSAGKIVSENNCCMQTGIVVCQHELLYAGRNCCTEPRIVRRQDWWRQ